MSQLSSNTIQKYSKAKTSTLKAKAIRVFNAWIRKRDEGKPCISCGSFNTQTASHFYSAGQHNHMRFVPDNVWTSCIRCNYFLSGNLNEYRKRLIEKIGAERVAKLDAMAADKKPHPDNRFLYIEIILNKGPVLVS